MHGPLQQIKQKIWNMDAIVYGLATCESTDLVLPFSEELAAGSTSVTLAVIEQICCHQLSFVVVVMR